MSALAAHRLSLLKSHIISSPTLQPLAIIPCSKSYTSISNNSNYDKKSLTIRDRAFYKYFLPIQTRWSDNDQYGHVNNSIYYHYFDTVVNSYLIRNCGLQPSPSSTSTNPIGLVISSHATYHAPISFPSIIDTGLAVAKIGNSSVTYLVGVFAHGEDVAAVTGGYTHVFVAGFGGRPVKVSEVLREGLEKIKVEPEEESKEEGKK